MSEKKTPPSKRLIEKSPDARREWSERGGVHSVRRTSERLSNAADGTFQAVSMTVIVPTKDRPDDLRRLLASIAAGSRHPDCLMIVDGSDDPIENVVNEFSDLQTQYLRVRPPSLPRQRNAGLEALPEGSEWVGFFDDDLVIDEDCLQKIEEFILAQREPQLRGIGLTIRNQPESQVGWFNRIFLIGDQHAGRVTPSGYAAAIPVVQNTTEVDWLYGGATFWERSVFDEFRYDEWFKGTGYLEDVDFSFRVSRQYKLMVCSEAQCLHLSHPIRRSKQASIGEWQIVAWWYFVNKYPGFSRFFVFWGMLGVLLKNCLSLLIHRSLDAGLRACGNLRGLTKIVLGTAASASGFTK